MDAVLLHPLDRAYNRQCFFGCGVILVFSGVFTFLVDSYPNYSASALAANGFVRSMFAAMFPLFGDASKLCSDGLGSGALIDDSVYKSWVSVGCVFAGYDYAGSLSFSVDLL